MARGVEVYDALHRIWDDVQHFVEGVQLKIYFAKLIHACRVLVGPFGSYKFQCDLVWRNYSVFACGFIRVLRVQIDKSNECCYISRLKS